MLKLTQLPPALLVVISASLLILGDALAAKWGRTGSHLYLALLCVIAPLGYIFFGLLAANKSLAVSSGLVNMAILVGAILVGMIFFGDQLSTRQCCGLVLACVSIALMSGG